VSNNAPARTARTTKAARTETPMIRGVDSPLDPKLPAAAELDGASVAAVLSDVGVVVGLGRLLESGVTGDCDSDDGVAVA